MLNVNLELVKPKEDYFTLAERWGIPHIRARWCCRALKVNPIRKFLLNHKDKIVFDGIRADESRQRTKRKFVEWHKIFECFVCHPILSWNNEEKEKYIKKMSLPINPAYKKGFKRASECWCGVFKSPKEFEILYNNYPNFFDKLVKLESMQKSGFAYIWSNGKKIYLKDLKEKICST